MRVISLIIFNNIFMFLSGTIIVEPSSIHPRRSPKNVPLRKPSKQDSVQNSLCTTDRQSSEHVVSIHPEPSTSQRFSELHSECGESRLTDFTDEPQTPHSSFPHSIQFPRNYVHSYSSTATNSSTRSSYSGGSIHENVPMKELGSNSSFRYVGVDALPSSAHQKRRSPVPRMGTREITHNLSYVDYASDVTPFTKGVTPPDALLSPVDSLRSQVSSSTCESLSEINTSTLSNVCDTSDAGYHTAESTKSTESVTYRKQYSPVYF